MNKCRQDIEYARVQKNKAIIYTSLCLSVTHRLPVFIVGRNFTPVLQPACDYCLLIIIYIVMYVCICAMCTLRFD